MSDPFAHGALPMVPSARLALTGPAVPPRTSDPIAAATPQRALQLAAGPPAICRLSAWGSLVQRLEADWRHQVVDIDRGGVAARCGAVYVGCNARLGDTAFGNRPHPPHNALDAARPQLHRAAVDDFWARLMSEDGAALLQRVRGELRGRRLACHCVGRRVVDGEGVRVPDACLPCHGHSLAAAANCTTRQLAQIAEAIHTHERRSDC